MLDEGGVGLQSCVKMDKTNFWPLNNPRSSMKIYYLRKRKDEGSLIKTQWWICWKDFYLNSNQSENYFLKFEHVLLVADREDGDAGAVALEALVLDEDLGSVAIAASPPS